MWYGKYKDMDYLGWQQFTMAPARISTGGIYSQEKLCWDWLRIRCSFVNGDAMESFSGQSVVKNELVLFYERGR